MRKKKPANRFSHETESRETEMPGGGMEENGAARLASFAMSGESDEGEEEMPAGGMSSPKRGKEPTSGGRRRASEGQMPRGMPMAEGAQPGAEENGEPQRVLVEMRLPRNLSAAAALQWAARADVDGFQIDSGYTPVPVPPDADRASALAANDEQVVVVRGTVDRSRRAELESQPNVIRVWDDTRIAPFPSAVMGPPEAVEVEEEPAVEIGTVVMPMEGFAACPIGTCDCSPGTAKGTIADVAQYLGVDQIWATGIRGAGMVIGIVDGGITAVGRPVRPAESGTPKVARIIGGWPAADWGTTAAAWSNHGNMTSTDALGMAPEAQVYDIRISDGSAISNALAGFQWAIDQHRANGTPHLLSNSWGIFQESWDRDYASNPNHPFTRKVVEALNEGILVLFAAGNCGGTCPDGRCGPDTGPGRSIWGANGHPLVMTVGAVNKNEQFVGYSSQGPAALDPQKPDFCGITHFQGYFASDSGTSAATPIVAGVVALLKQSSPSATQDQIKQALKETAKDIGPAGWDQHSGTGIIRAKAAFDRTAGAPRASGPVVAWGPNRLDVFVLGTDRAAYHKWWNGAAWGPSVTGYEQQGGVCLTAPEVAAWSPNRLDVFVLGTDRALYHKWWNGAAWGPSLTGWESLGGVCASPPKVVAWGPNRLDVFVLGTDSAVYHKWWNGSAWGPSLTGWESLGGVCSSPVEAVAWGPNRLDLFVLGTNRALFHKWWDGSSWGPSLTGWEAMSGVCTSTPKAVAWGPNRLDVFVLGTDSQLFHKWWNGSAWGPSLTGYEAMGGICVGRPEVVAWGPNRLDVFVIGTDSALYHKWWSGSAWGPSLTGYEYMGGACQREPRAVAWGPNRLDVFVIGTDSALYHKWWNGAAWGPSLTGYEPMGGVIVDF